MAVAPVSTGSDGLGWTRPLVSRLLGGVREPFLLCSAIEAVAAIVIPGGRGLFFFEERVWTILTSDDGSYQIVYAHNGEVTSYRSMASCQVIQIVYDRNAGSVAINQKTLDLISMPPHWSVASRRIQASRKIDPAPPNLIAMGGDLVGFRRPYEITLLEFIIGWRDLQCILRIMVCIASALEHLHEKRISHGDVNSHYCRLVDVRRGEAFLAMPLCSAPAFDRVRDWRQFVRTFGEVIFRQKFTPFAMHPEWIITDNFDAMLIAFLRTFVIRQGSSETIKFENMNDLMEVLRENSEDDVGWLYASLRAFISVHQLLYQLACICQDAERMRRKFKPKSSEEVELIYQMAAGCFDLEKFVTGEIRRILKEYFRMCKK
jgi:hypothetical protein